MPNLDAVSLVLWMNMCMYSVCLIKIRNECQSEFFFRTLKIVFELVGCVCVSVNEMFSREFSFIHTPYAYWCDVLCENANMLYTTMCSMRSSLFIFLNIITNIYVCDVESVDCRILILCIIPL